MVPEGQSLESLCPNRCVYPTPRGHALMRHDLVLDHGAEFVRPPKRSIGIVQSPAVTLAEQFENSHASVALCLSGRASAITLVILSALKAIPAEIFEAVELDNAPKWMVFFRLTLPLLSPQLFFLLIVITINSFKVFDTIRIMTGGGPGSATDVLAYYIYRYAFKHFRIGYASAAGTVLMVILMIFTALYFAVLGRRVHYQQ